MRPVGQPVQRWVVLACMAALPCAAALAADCQPPVLGALAGVERSHWQERDAQGASLLHERGTLRLVGLEAGSHCSGVDWSARWTLARGERDYDGRTTAQAPFQTVTRIEAQQLAAQAWVPVQTAWAVGAQLGYRHIDRDIAGRGNVLGYPERFGYWQAALGARYQAALGEQLRLTASAWLGGGPPGRVRLDLPRADPVTLRLGSSRLLALDLLLDGGKTAEQPGWAWQAGLTYRYEQHQAGPAQTLVLNETPGRSPPQPHTVTQHPSTTINATYRF